MGAGGGGGGGGGGRRRRRRVFGRCCCCRRRFRFRRFRFRRFRFLSSSSSLLLLGQSPSARHGRPLPHVVAHLRPQLQAHKKLPSRRQRAQPRQQAPEAAPDVGDGDSRRGLAPRPRHGKGLLVQVLPRDVPGRVREVGVEAVGERVGVGAGAVEALARVADGSLGEGEGEGEGGRERRVEFFSFFVSVVDGG